MPSVFTRIVQRQLPARIVAEDAHHLAFLDAAPRRWGHILVMPKQEVDYLFDLAPEALKRLTGFTQQVAIALRAAVPCRRVAVQVLGLEVPHAHVHLLPIDREADAALQRPAQRYTEAQLDGLQAAIRQAFEDAVASAQH